VDCLSSASDMTHLLTLPRELRDEIIQLVLVTPLSLPRNVERKAANDPKQVAFANRIHYLVSESDSRPTALGLLLASHKLYVETREALAKINMIFTVDLAIINECWLWPTWRFIPTRTHPCLEQLNINLRMCCTSEERQLQTGFAQRNERHVLSPHPIVQTLCGFLARFLSLGACADITPKMEEGIMQNDREYKRNFRIKCLQLNIQTDSLKNEETSYEQVPGRTIAGLRHLVNDPLYIVDLTASCELERWLCGAITQELRYRWGMRDNFLSERFGIIAMCIDGSMIHEIDIAQITKPEASYGEERMFLDKRRKVRRELGLEPYKNRVYVERPNR
jgi:hypothetical protein